MPKSVEKSTALIEALYDIDLPPRSYSGRWMFGKECVAIVLNSDEGLSQWYVARTLAIEYPELDIPEPNIDSMGLGTVLYWPSYPWPEGMESD